MRSALARSRRTSGELTAVEKVGVTGNRQTGIGHTRVVWIQHHHFLVRCR